MIPRSIRNNACKIWLQSDGRVEKKGGGVQTHIHTGTQTHKRILKLYMVEGSTAKQIKCNIYTNAINTSTGILDIITTTSSETVYGCITSDIKYIFKTHRSTYKQGCGQIYTLSP